MPSKQAALNGKNYNFHFDVEDYHLINPNRYKWKLMEDCYGNLHAGTYIKKKNETRLTYMEFLIFGLEQNEKKIIHLDGNTLNNRRHNLKVENHQVIKPIKRYL